MVVQLGNNKIWTFRRLREFSRCVKYRNMPLSCGMPVSDLVIDSLSQPKHLAIGRYKNLGMHKSMLTFFLQGQYF